jgi:hypothetical protein
MLPANQRTLELNTKRRSLLNMIDGQNREAGDVPPSIFSKDYESISSLGELRGNDAFEQIEKSARHS